MAGKSTAYTQKAVTTTIQATSRASVKVGDSFYTVEYQEQRMIPDVPGIDLLKEKELLWDACNTEVDHQIEDILKTFKK